MKQENLLALLFFCTLVPVCAATDAAGADISQWEAMAAAHKLNKTGSDDSLQASTTSAMRALMELSKQNIGTAISHGYKAYGQYRNSDELDDLRVKNAISALKMDSIGSYLQKDGKDSVFLAPMSDFDTSYKRLNPTFLREGRAGQIAEEFEKTTGMKRETFLKYMAKASESDITADDPQLVDKVLSRFEGFLKEIPNEDFRKKVEIELARIPQSVRSGLISKAVVKFTSMIAGGAEKETRKSDPAQIPSSTDIASSSQKKGADAAASESSVASAIVRVEFRGLANETFDDDAIGSALQAALEGQREDTIFKQISRKYRSLAPELSERASE